MNANDTTLPHLPLSTMQAGRTARLIPLGRPLNIPVPVGAFLVLGSDAGCGLRLDDPSVMPRHARIESRGDSWVIRDLQSNTGVFVNETRISEAPLNDQDRLRIGEVVLLFRNADDSSDRMISRNELWQRQLERLPSFATTDFPVLMIGPSGSGKEVLAKTIHNSSKRRSGPFVSINCSALSESLIESELFGHVRGSFTGSTSDRKGAFEVARGGTLFLDEIGDLPLSLQPKLLRALENKEIRPVGSDRTIETDVRVLSATHKDLAQAVRLGRFREDLYWRLNVCQIRPPALRDRMEDFTDLVYFFCKQMRVRLSHAAIERLRCHPWPGNIRELRNVIARAAAYFPGHYIQVEEINDLVDAVSYDGHSDEFSALSVTELKNYNTTGVGQTGGVMREIEREMIIRRLVANRGNQRKTAADLGMPKSTLHDRLKIYSIDLATIKRQA